MKRTHCDLCNAECPQVGRLVVDLPQTVDHLLRNYDYELCPAHSEELRKVLTDWVLKVAEEVRQAALAKESTCP